MATYVIGDVHGCYYSLLALLEQIELNKADRLLFVGDLINKGPHSRKVVDLLMKMQDMGYQLQSVRGNHEQKLLDIEHNRSLSNINEYKRFYSASRSYAEFFTPAALLRPRYKQFFESLPYFIELESYYIVHAGFNCKKNEALQDTHSMMNIRNWHSDYNPEVLGGKSVIHGHQSVSLDETRARIAMSSPRVVPVDTGCVYFRKRREFAYLTAIRLSDNALYTQINLDQLGQR